MINRADLFHKWLHVCYNKQSPVLQWVTRFVKLMSPGPNSGQFKHRIYGEKLESWMTVITVFVGRFHSITNKAWLFQTNVATYTSLESISHFLTMMSLHRHVVKWNTITSHAHTHAHLCAAEDWDTKWENMASAVYTGNENRDTQSH